MLKLDLPAHRARAGLIGRGAGLLLALITTPPLAWSQAASPPPDAPAAARPPAAAASAPTVEVRDFEVTGNTLLPAGEIAERLAPFKGMATVARLREAAAAVQELYRRAGWGGVVAFLPEQALDSGVVRIRVVEGKLSRVDVADNKQFSTANVLASLPSLQVGSTPAVRRIDAEIQLANENPAKSVQVLLQPGAEPGSIAAKLNVAEQPVQRFNARLDNTGNKRSGRWRAALGWQHANVMDMDHVFAAEFQTAPEHASSVMVLSANYRMPFYAQAMAVDVYGAWSDVDAGKVGTQAGDLEFSGKGYIAGARANKYLPRWGNVDQRLIAGLEWREYLNNCSISGLPDGACGSAGASVSVQPLSLTYSAQAVSEVRLGFSIGLHQNLGLGGGHGKQSDFDAVRQGSQRRYTLLRFAAQAAVPVAEWGTLAARLQGQASGKPLVPGELFGIGGAQSVRGFEERELGGDSGVQFTTEFTSASVAESWFKLTDTDLRGVVFADAGWVRNQQNDPCLGSDSTCHMGSLGVGLRAQWRQVQLRLDLARAMSTASTTKKGDGRVHLGLNASF